MVILVKLFGIVMVGFGVAFLVSRDSIKKYLNYWKKENRIYLGGVISILVGIILLVAASECRVSWFVILMGVWALIKGIIIFVLGPQKMAAKMDWWISRSAKVLRLLAISTLILGASLIYAV